MALRIWLSDSIKDSPNFKKGADGTYMFGDIIHLRLCSQRGEFYLQLEGGPNSILPITHGINVFFRLYSYQEEFHSIVHRCTGWYSGQSADGWLDLKGGKYHLYIEGIVIDDIQILHSLIRSGQITPDASWECSQITANHSEPPPASPTMRSSDLSLDHRGEEEWLGDTLKPYTGS